jgi:hypothetical protein
MSTGAKQPENEIIYLHLLPTLRMNGGISPFTLFFLMARVHLYLPLPRTLNGKTHCCVC